MYKFLLKLFLNIDAWKVLNERKKIVLTESSREREDKLVCPILGWELDLFSELWVNIVEKKFH